MYIKPGVLYSTSSGKVLSISETCKWSCTYYQEKHTIGNCFILSGFLNLEKCCNLYVVLLVVWFNLQMAGPARCQSSVLPMPMNV